MCGICGCGDAHMDGDDPHDHGHDARHAAMHAAGIPHDHDDLADAPDPQRTIRLEQAILGQNDRLAAKNRADFQSRGILALNLLSSPGSGKTTFLCETIKALAGRLPVAVIEGDQDTSFDADRIRETGAPAIQVNTGKGCHLDAAMIAEAASHLPLDKGAVLFVENVGNLVCPAAFDLGEAAKVVLLSVTEGEDKPLKYPDMFAAADLLILNKIDLAPYVAFDIARCIGLAHRINPSLQVFQVSATTGEGLPAWLGWIEDRRDGLLAAV